MKRKLTTQLKEILNSNFFVKTSSTKISLFQKKKKKKNAVSLSENSPVPKLQEEQVIKCESKIMESKLLNSLKSMKNDKSLGSMASQISFMNSSGKKLKLLFPI